MYFIKYQPLKKQLLERSLSDREALPYVFLYVGLTSLMCSVPLYDGFNMWDGVSSALTVLLAIGGVLYAYSKNGGKEGHDLIQKYVVLGWVVFVRFFLISIPVMILLFRLGHMAGLVTQNSTRPYDVVVVALLEAIFYQRVGRHVKDTKIKTSEPVK